jgi:broad specificity phosphatase PhoE
MILYCVRHGQSIYNAEGRIQGHCDVGLSPLGLQQSEALAEALAERPIDAVYSSPLRRAAETAGPVAEKLRLPLRTDPRLMEIHAGIFQGKRSEEVRRLYPVESALWRQGDMDFRIPGGESRRDLTRRGCDAFADILMGHHTEVAVVAHGRLLTVTLNALLNLPEDEWLTSLDNGSITTVRFQPDGEAELLELDETEHLSRVGMGSRGDL